jgi:hypothetical protein
VAVQKKSCHQFIRTLIVRFIGGYSGIYDRGKRPFSPVTGAGAASILLGGEANSSLEERKSYWQRMWVRPTVCRLLALNVGSLAGIVSPGLPLLARNVSRKCPLFASSRATVCEPLQLVVVSVPKDIPGTPTGDFHPISSCPCRAYTCRSTRPLGFASRRVNSGVCAVHAVMLGGESPLSRCAWSRRTSEAQGRHREVGSEGSVERMCGATDRNRIQGVVRSGRVGTRP